MNSEIDTCFKKYLSDSIVAIIDDAKSVRMELHAALQDSASTDSVRVSKEIGGLVKFVILDDDSFLSDAPAKGLFRPWATIVYEGKKKKTVSVELDFGLWKWRIVDAERKVICTRDMGKNKKQFFRIINTLFPENQKLKTYYEFVTKQQSL